MVPNWPLTIEVLLLVVLANGAPVLACLALQGALAAPVDGGRVMADGRPLLGPTKTWRGLGAALALTPVAALALGLSWTLGLLVAAGAMLADLAVSFVKRRLGLAPSARVLALDEVPEALVPALLVSPQLGLAVLDVLLIVLGFLLADWLLSPLAGRRRGHRTRA
jgi:CDP-2,3-bis-(O-geranylgeranyl)-sn-glycerol synthase